MEKYVSSPRLRSPPTRLIVTFCLSLVLLSCFQLRKYYTIWSPPWFTSSNSSSGLKGSQDFRWRNLKPSQSLDYTSCFGSYQCAYLSVPLNWNTSVTEQIDGPRASIAVIKLPAKVPVTDPRYAGAVILNPGGPGESGVSQVLVDAKNIQTILDSPGMPSDGNLNSTNEKYFSVMSFDPRGVNNTLPGLRCFPYAMSQKSWLLTYTDYGLLWDSESIIGLEWARAAALGASCSQEDEGKEILRYVNTAQVVEDMVEIIEREGEWRAKEARKLISAHGRIESSFSQAALDRTAYFPGQEKLQYWGMSYGTVIGSTFSAMHPDRVGRVVIDGVVDPADHYAGGWLTQLQDSDMIISKFSENCFEAGPQKCPLYTGSSGADVKKRFTSIMTSMRMSPIPIVLPADRETVLGPDIVTYGDTHLYLLSGMYFSFAMAEELFNLVHLLETRNSTSPELANIVTAKQAILNQHACPPNEPLCDQDIPYVSQMGSFQSISCMDSGGGPSNLTREDFHSFLSELRAQGRWISPSWARNKLVCLGHSVPPAWKPDLDFVKQEWKNTSHPLLIIGNSHDTVTPLRNAHRVSTLFPGSVVLQQNSEGHCSHSNPSICSGKMVREYFQTGRLPAEGTVCEPEIRPFVGCVRKGGCKLDDRDDERLWEAMVELADPFGLRTKMSLVEKHEILRTIFT